MTAARPLRSGTAGRRATTGDITMKTLGLLALPALIFGAVSRQTPGDFLNAPFWISSRRMLRAW